MNKYIKMEEIKIEDLREIGITDSNGLTIIQRTNDGIRKFKVINGKHKGSTVHYNHFDHTWTLYKPPIKISVI